MAQTETVVTTNGKKVEVNPYANNGLEANNGYIQLGSALTKSSVLTTTNTFTLAIEGLIAGSSTDNILVIDSNKILRTVSASSLAGTNWSLIGNGETNPTDNFLGTTDNQPLRFKIDNTNAGILAKTYTALGFNAYNTTATGLGNTAIGVGALNVNTSGYSNTAVGFSTLNANSTGGANTAVGSSVLRLNTSGQNNTAIGSIAMQNNSTGIANTALGSSSLTANETGNWNTAIGSGAVSANINGDSNTGVGNFALYNNTTGKQNTSLGDNALRRNTTGSNNTSLGFQSGRNVGGNNNITLGSQVLTGVSDADITLYTGDKNIAIGDQLSLSSRSASNEMNIGNTLYGTSVNNVIGTGKIGINTNAPTTELDVNGYARVRTMDAGALTDNVVTVDTNGNLRQRAPIDVSAFTLGFAPLGAGVDLTSSGSFTYTGSRIVLPPGKWLVTVNMLLTKSSSAVIWTGSTESWWVRSGFSNSSTVFSFSPDVVSTNTMVSGLLAPSSPYGLLSGTVIINNTTAASKT